VFGKRGAREAERGGRRERFALLPFFRASLSLFLVAALARSIEGEGLVARGQADVTGARGFGAA
jgi:hypothetical protein